MKNGDSQLQKHRGTVKGADRGEGVKLRQGRKIGQRDEGGEGAEW